MSEWKASTDELPPNGQLVFVCDFEVPELATAFYTAWYASGQWHSRQVWTRRGELAPRYWMAIPPLPDNAI